MTWRDAVLQRWLSILAGLEMACQQMRHPKSHYVKRTPKRLFLMGQRLSGDDGVFSSHIKGMDIISRLYQEIVSPVILYFI
jgi:hypothetical protein